MLPECISMQGPAQRHALADIERTLPCCTHGPHAGGRVVLSSGVAVEYDWLVLALGADSVFFGIEGVKEHCVPFCTYSDAMRVYLLFAL